jgi:PAS domain S-box-containing protein
MTHGARVPVLLVDDKRANLMALEAVLASDDYELVSVSSGENALREVQRRDFAVVLLDVQMPQMDGFQTAMRLRAIGDERPPVPIIFVTGIDGAPSGILRAYAEGGVDFIQKPLQSAIVCAKVSVFAELYRARAGLAAQQENTARALRALTDLALVLSETRTPDEVAAAIVDEGMKVAQADTCSLYLLDEAEKVLDLIGHRGVAPEIISQTRRLTEADAPATFAALSAATITRAETATEYARLYPKLGPLNAAGRRARAFWSVPLIAEGRPVGLLGMGFYDERRFPPEERVLMETMGRQCAQALLRAVRFNREAQAHAWLSTTLRSIGDAVIATDAAGFVTFMNAVAQQLTGWTEGDARGRPIDEVFAISAEETGASCESPVTRVLRERKVVGLANHTVLRSKGGTQIAIDDSAAPIFDTQGTLAGVVLVFRDVTLKRRAEIRREFLARAGSALASSLDYRATFAAVARLAVPQLADWCSVTLREPGARAPQEVAVAHVDPEKARLARELGTRYPLDPDASIGVPKVIRSGKSELYTEPPWSMIEATAQDADHLRILRELRFESAMVVPLLGRERTLGAISFIFSESGRRYGEEDLAFAEEFARRAAMAIENALALKRTEEARVTQRQSSADELRASESRFHDLVDAVTEYAIFMLDATGHVATWNPGAQKTKGYEAHEIIGKHISVFYTPEDRAAGKPEHILETVRREGRFEDQSWRVRKDGARFWADVVITALRNERGEVTGFAKVTRDLSERRKADEALRASEERFHLLVNAVTDYAIFMLDATGHVATWNAGAQRTKGYEPNEIIGRHFSIFYTTEDRAAGKPERILETVRREGRFEEETWRLRKDGTRFWADVVITSLRDEKGVVTGFAKVTRDQTARRAAEENELTLIREQLARAAAETERRRLLTLLNQVPATVNFFRGPDMVFEFAHPKTLEAMGWRDLLGRPLLVAAPEFRDQPYFELLRRVYESGEPIEQQEVPAWLEVDGNRVETYSNSVYLPVRNASGAVEGVMTFDIDVTESVFARRELERVNRAKDEFLATMSHELRTPLNAITGWATILRRNPLDAAKLDRGLEVIERNAKTQTRLVSDLLDVSRIISGKLQLSVVKTEVFPLIVAASDVVRHAAEGKGVRLVVDVDPGVGATMGDPDRIQQVIWNLLTNAIRFTPRGGRVVIMADRAASGIAIRVQDTGAGIAVEHLPHIFERFKQVDSSTTRAHGGLGLGLAIVRHLVEAHGGSVDAQSEGLGRGATFTVNLPIRAVDTSRPETTAPATATDANDVAPTGASLHNVRVLVVDDDADSIEVLRMVLETAGAKVTTATSARDAFDALDARGPFEIIVSDIGMPEMDGYSFMRSLRSRPSSAHVPAIALTAYARSEDAELARSAGYQEHLAKPIDERRLVDAIKTWSQPTPTKSAWLMD